MIVAAAWLAGETRPAIAIRKALAPSLRDSPAIAYSVAGAVLLLIVLWGPTPAFRNFWWIVVFAVLLALGVTMLRRETAVEFPDLEPGQTLGSLRQQRAHVGARTTVTGDSTELGIRFAPPIRRGDWSSGRFADQLLVWPGIRCQRTLEESVEE